MSNSITGSSVGLIGVLVDVVLVEQILKQTKKIGEQAGFKKKKGGKNA